MRKDLKQWVTDHKLDLEQIGDNTFEIKGVGKFLLIYSKEGKIIDTPNLNLIISDEEREIFDSEECNFYLFSFGGLFYYSDSDLDLDFDQFVYLGNAKRKIDTDFCHLGVHGGYEVLNGSRLYPDWISKTLFLGFTSLGICEKNTLAGVLEFQLKCSEKEIKSVIGETITVKNKEDDLYDIKLYVKNSTGWKNLLRINREINVTNPTQFITESELFKYSEGLICVITTLTPLTKKLIRDYNKSFKELFFQIDSVEFVSDEQDRKILIALKNYFNSEFFNLIPPVLLNDSYYLEKSHAKIKKLMNSFRSGGGFEFLSENQYYKDVYDSFSYLSQLFKDDKLIQGKEFFDLFDEMVENTVKISDLCEFKINTKGFKLPKFEFKGLDPVEYGKFIETEDVDGLFWYLMKKATDKKLKHLSKADKKIYADRIDREYGVIQAGGFVGYFLVLWDIIDFCNRNNILTGLGRGSAGGSLVSYLLDVTKIDPIKYKLLFERFLNEGRIKVTLPDIDTDFESDRREEVKRYMEEKYGVSHVASIGTYNTYKVKSAFQDLARVFSIPAQKADYLSKVIEDGFDGRWTKGEIKYFFKTACINKDFYELIQEYPDLINNTGLIMKQPSSCSIHPCATVISPKVDEEGNEMTIFEWMPIKRDKATGILVTEWTGEVLADIGFLKEDILGINQLDKFREIFKLILLHTGKKMTYDDIILDEPEVMELFQKGISQDIFQFGTQTLIDYTKRVQPYNVEELIAINAIFRPGPIDSGAHDDFVAIKFGDKEAVYDKHLKEVTESTYGLYVYQEQVMAAASILGDFNLTEADDVRRAMGKIKASAMEPYKIRFKEGAIKKGYTELEAQTLWDKLLRFSSYGYNRSHAAAYAITAYFCQWLKYHYPIEFYTVSLTFCRDEQVPLRVNEINQLGSIRVSPPDINSSTDQFIPDPKEKVIYWSLTKIKFVGDVAVKCITEERDKNGQFFSLEEFLERVDTSKVNLRVVFNLIIAGAFDKTERVKGVNDRYRVLKKFYEIRKLELSKEDFPPDLIQKEYFWNLKQKEITGLGEVDYSKIFRESSLRNFELIKESEIYEKQYDSKKTYVLAGILTQIAPRKPKKDPENVFAQLTLNVNDIEIFVTMWNETWTEFGPELNKWKGGIVLISGNCKFDSFKGKNVLYSNQRSEVIFL